MVFAILLYIVYLCFTSAVPLDWDIYFLMWRREQCECVIFFRMFFKFDLCMHYDTLAENHSYYSTYLLYIIFIPKDGCCFTKYPLLMRPQIFNFIYLFLLDLLTFFFGVLLVYICLDLIMLRNSGSTKYFVSQDS